MKLILFALVSFVSLCTAHAQAKNSLAVTPPGEVSKIMPALPSGTELYLVGSYEGTASPLRRPFVSARMTIGDFNQNNWAQAWERVDRQFPGDTIINVTRKGRPLVIAMASYDPVKWHVNVFPGVDVRALVVVGYDAPVAVYSEEKIPVVAPADPRTGHVRHYFYQDDSLPGFVKEWRYINGRWQEICTDVPATPESDYTRAAKFLSSFTQLPVAGATGKYTGGVFTVDDAAIGTFIPKTQNSRLCYK